MRDFAAIDFETTGYENGNVNEPWQWLSCVTEWWQTSSTRSSSLSLNIITTGIQGCMASMLPTQTQPLSSPMCGDR